jgi:oligogalacturonide lyase
MQLHPIFLVTLLLSPLVLAAQGPVSPASPATGDAFSWVDSDTGHRVMRLTAEPGSAGLYFNQNAFTSNGQQMIYAVNGSIYALDMTTYASRELVPEKVPDTVSSIIVGKTTPTVYFMKRGNDGLFAVDVASAQIRQLAVLPKNATISSLNADETLIAGTYVEGEVPRFSVDPNLKESSRKAALMDERLAAHLPMVLFTFNLKTAEIRPVLHSTDWLSHVQFSPKDPNLLLYCHEGLWWKVDRIWSIHTDGSHITLVHKRTVKDEIAGHEFWDADGVTIWYDLQIPHGQNFYLASYNTDTGAREWYSVERDAWSIHFNAASDDSIFCGDGGDYAQVAKSKNGQWIELFSPKQTTLPGDAGIDQSGLTQSGYLQAHHLVNMAKQDYTLEPNVRFSPDNKLVIFTSNILGPPFIFAVEVAKANVAPPPAAGK